VKQLDPLEARTWNRNTTARGDGSEASYAEDAAQGGSAEKGLCVLQQAFRLAQEMGARLGDDLDLLRPLPRYATA